MTSHVNHCIYANLNVAQLTSVALVPHGKLVRVDRRNSCVHTSQASKMLISGFQKTVIDSLPLHLRTLLAATQSTLTAASLSPL